MADGRKNNGGHSTKGRAGRPPKAKEIKLAESMDNLLDVPDVLANLAKLVNTGDLQAIKLWLEYRLGKPQQGIDLTSGGDKIKEFTVTVVNKPDEG